METGGGHDIYERLIDRIHETRESKESEPTPDIRGYEADDGYVFPTLHPRIEEELRGIIAGEAVDLDKDPLDLVREALERKPWLAIQAYIKELRGDV